MQQFWPGLLTFSIDICLYMLFVINGANHADLTFTHLRYLKTHSQQRKGLEG